jgi:hypothetical protein
MGAALLNCLPGEMTFEEYFQLDGQPGNLGHEVQDTAIGRILDLARWTPSSGNNTISAILHKN